MRTARMPVVVVALLAVLLLGVGCSSDTGDGGDASTKSAEPTQDPAAVAEDRGAMLTAQFETWLEENHGSEPWYQDVSGFAYTTRLREPALLVFVDLDTNAMAAAANGAGNEWANSEMGDALAVRWISLDGTVFQGGMPLSMRHADSVPAPPAAADEFMTWLDSAYGPASGDPVDEDWYGRITGAGLSADGESVEVSTDLDFESLTDKEQAEVISQVLQLGRPAGVSGWIVRYGDGEFMYAGIYQ